MLLREAERKRRTVQTAYFWARICLDRDDETSLQRQLYEQIRHGIAVGMLPAGSRLPSSRSLASELACSRTTILEVLRQLIAEEYVTGLRGSGVYVAAEIPDKAFNASASPNADEPSSQGVPENLSRRGLAIESTSVAYTHAAFMSSLPDVSLFPIHLWLHLLAQEWREHSTALMREVDPRGFAPLREAIAQYVVAARNLICSPDQVIITSGAAQGIDLVARLLLDTGERVWTEDPGYPPIRALLRAAGADVVPIPMDAEGINFFDHVDAPPRLIVVSPTHQYPTGTMMTNERRCDLLQYARSVGAWIVEDDYDSEFCYSGRSLAALASVSSQAAGRIVYVGTFSKLMFPAIRLGYLIVPEHLVRKFASARAVIDLQPSILPQPALARFISEGYLLTYLRRMRPIYRKRQEALVTALSENGSDLLTVNHDSAGMHLLGRFTPGLAMRKSDVGLAQSLERRQIYVQPLSALFANADAQRGFVLGFACADEAALISAVARMLDVLRE